MAVVVSARKCRNCAGALKYEKDIKAYRCLYCGALHERTEEYDGLFTIKNVVRQVLLDVAYRRMESAQKNLVECEKIDSRYIGTVIGKIAYEMVCIITPEACPPGGERNLYAQLKRDYERLQEFGTTVTDEEEILYEFFDESDIFATLLLVYDTINDQARREYVAKLIEPEKILSRYANTNLLTYYIKNDDLKMADRIIDNARNIDVVLAFCEILSKYPDNEEKIRNVEKLFATGEIKPEKKLCVINYIENSKDKPSVKARILVLAMENSMNFGMDIIVDNILVNVDLEQVRQVMNCVCKNKLNDEEKSRLIAFAYGCGKVQVARVVLGSLKESEQYVQFPAKYISNMLESEIYTIEEKVELLTASFEFRIESKAFDSVVTSYLCYNTDNEEARKAIIDCLFEKAVTFPTATVQTYVLKCSADKARKPEVIRQMFAKGLNLSFYNELLSQYMNSEVDSQEVKTEVVNTLMNLGIKTDSTSFTDYVCESRDSVADKIRFANKMIENGTQLRSNTANLYLEKTRPEDFSSELFSLIFVPTCSFSAKAIENYVLYCREREAVKTSNIKTILDLSPRVAEKTSCQITHLGKNISCNLLQAYILLSEDSCNVAFAITEALINSQKLKINEEITASGARMKFKKYVLANKENLSETTNAICEKYRVYSMFF